MTYINRIKAWAMQSRLAGIIAWLGVGVYGIQAWYYAHTQASVVDEGLYLLKGYLFSTGRYQPFQEFGPWMNHMPLSFLVPGYFQVWFGPGIRTGRYLALGLSICFLFGLWLVVRRMAGRWWAAAAIWSFALNLAVIKIYSVFTSQILVACMLIWVFVLAVGSDRSRWQILLGSFLAGLSALTRLNMIPLLPLLLLYLLWAYGWKTAAQAAAVGLLTFGLMHARYWPGILSLWAKWLPASLTPFLDQWRLTGLQSVWSPELSLQLRVMSFFEGIRYHFVPIWGAVVAMIVAFWGRKAIRQRREYRAIVFLGVFLVVMLSFHAWAALINDYCVFCFSTYISFFSATGILLMALVLAGWSAQDHRQPPRLLAWALIMLIGFGIVYYTRQTTSVYTFLDTAAKTVTAISVPGFKDGRFQGGSLPWPLMLSNKFGWDYYEAGKTAELITYLALGVFGVLVGVWGLGRLLIKSNAWGDRGPIGRRLAGGEILVAFLLLGGLLSPTVFFTGHRNQYDCKQDVITTFEATRAYLAESILPGARLYWSGGAPLSILLDLPVELYPPQFNGVYSYRLGGDPVDLERFGLWNEALARQWAAEADYILISEYTYTGWLQDYVETGEFVEISPTDPLNPCRENTSIHIYWRQSGDSHD